MQRYFFHLYENGERVSDDVGIECDSHDAVRQEAMQALPEIALDHLPQDGDRQAFTVMVTEEDGQPIYTATLTFAGLWLKEQ